MDECRLPNLLYVGADKAGSTWIAQTLATHPKVFVTPAKDLYFFDRYFDRGVDWYRKQFRGAQAQHRVVAEVCHDYLYSVNAAARALEVLGSDTKVVVTIREPFDRARSSFRYKQRFGYVPDDFAAALKAEPELLDHSRYGEGIARFVDAFGEANVAVFFYEQLRDDPQVFADALFGFVDVEPLDLDDDQQAPARAAQASRNPLVSRGVRAIAGAVRSLGHPRLVGAVKSSAVVSRMLYREPIGPAVTIDGTDRELVQLALSDDRVRLAAFVDPDDIDLWWGEELVAGLE